MRILLFLLLAPAFLTAQQEIQFHTGAWADALAKAKTENKLIFLDAYAAWCGPCKMMARQTFTDASVAQYYNANFVNAKIDMEKGEGPDLAQRYEVQAYPTLLFVDGNGTVVHRALGFHNKDQFLELGRAANDPAKNQRGLEQRYAAGDRTPELMQALLASKAAANDPNVSAIATEYLKTQTDWTSAANMEIILLYANDPASAPFDYFLQNRAKFTDAYGEEAVVGKSQTALGLYLRDNPEAPMAEVQQMIGKLIPGEEGEKLSVYYPVVFYQQTGDVDKYAEAAVAYFDRYPPDNWSELNEMAWGFYENVDDRAMLEKALEWAKKSVSMEANYYNTDTLAALYAKLGKKKLAIKHAKKAIELAKKSGDDASATEQLLAQLKGK